MPFTVLQCVNKDIIIIIKKGDFTKKHIYNVTMSYHQWFRI